MHRSRSVLVAEDSPTQRALVVDVLRDEGLEVHEADNGRLALDLCRIIRPDLLIVDLDLPNLTGTELIVKIRADHKSGGIPVLVLAGDEHERAVGGALDAGATDFVSKPADPRELIMRVRRALAA